MTETDIDTLNGAWGRPGRVAVTASPLGGPVVSLASPGGTATVALKGAQVLSWIPAGAAEVLWLSPLARLDAAKPPRGGIPVCWPWFADHPSDPTQPAHGFVRTAPWSIVDASADATTASVTLAIDGAEAGRGRWPGAAEARLTVTLAGTFDVALETRNTAAAPLAYTQALHTYFCVGEIARATVEGLAGHDYLDKLDGYREKPQRGRIILDRETDRIYLGAAPEVAVVDQDLKRRIVIRGRGSRTTVVWNPWIDKARRLGDMGETGWQRMVCVETANAGPDIVTLDPGRSHTLGVTLELQALAASG